jgi:RHS repeat-associated protein
LAHDAANQLYDGLDTVLTRDGGGLLQARYLRGLAIDEPWQLSGVTVAGEGGPSNGLVGWWKFNEGMGPTAADSSGNGNTGTLQTGATWATGVAGNAVSLDASGNVSVANDSTLQNNPTWTFAAWINPDAFNSSSDAYLFYKDKVLLWGFRAATSRQLTVNIGTGSGGNPWKEDTTSSAQLSSNTWTHIAVTYTNSTVKFYMNGFLSDTLTQSYSMGTGSKAFSISTSAQSFAGKLDDARYYKRALSDSEIAQIYGEQATNRVYLADALGSIVALTDSSGAISNEYDYEPFGVVTNNGLSLNSYKFTAREDDGTGLYYYRARYYHPALGRFVSEDLLRGGNLYAYCFDKPLKYRDALGLEGGNPISAGGDAIYYPLNGWNSANVPGGTWQQLNASGLEIGLNADIVAAKAGTVAAVVISIAPEEGITFAILNGIVVLQAMTGHSGGSCPQNNENEQPLLGMASEGLSFPFRQRPIEDVFRNLEEYHGISENLASLRLHQIKEASGFGGKNVVVDMTGNVYNPFTGELIGSLTQGGGDL